MDVDNSHNTNSNSNSMAVDQAEEPSNGVQSEQKDDEKTEERITTPYLTKYEKARILGTRALQISMGAPVMVELQGETCPLEIATKELRVKQIPIIIRRYLPDGDFE